MYYYKKPIYIILYIKNNETLVSYNRISDMNQKHIRFSHNLNDNNEKSLLFNFENNKLIGIHNKGFNYSNKGLFFKYIIDKFIQTYKNKNTENYNKNYNEISIKVNIDKGNINKDIYFLDNHKDLLIKKEHLFELNELNTKLYIDKKEYSYKKYLNLKKKVYIIL